MLTVILLIVLVAVFIYVVFGKKKNNATKEKPFESSDFVASVQFEGPLKNFVFAIDHTHKRVMYATLIEKRIYSFNDIISAELEQTDSTEISKPAAAQSYIVHILLRDKNNPSIVLDYASDKNKATSVVDHVKVILDSFNQVKM